MYRNIIAIALSLSFILLAREGIESFRSVDMQEAPVKVKKQDKSKDKKRPVVPNLQFYPSVPSPLPDLYAGYLFNEERFLEKEGDKDKEEPKDESGTELAVDIETVYYTGSIIIGNLRKGLISYSPKRTPAAAKKTKRPVKKPASRQKSIKYAQLVAGDSLSGYKVVSVEADRIVFEKGSETVEKMLYDSEKKRIVPPPPPKKKVVKRKATASTSKKKRVVLGKKAPTIRKRVQTTRKGSTSNKTTKPQIRVPGLPPKP